MQPLSKTAKSAFHVWLANLHMRSFDWIIMVPAKPCPRLHCTGPDNAPSFWISGNVPLKIFIGLLRGIVHNYFHEIARCNSHKKFLALRLHLSLSFQLLSAISVVTFHYPGDKHLRFPISTSESSFHRNQANIALPVIAVNHPL